MLTRYSKKSPELITLNSLLILIYIDKFQDNRHDMLIFQAFAALYCDAV